MTLKMKALYTYKMSVTVYNLTQHNIPEDLDLWQHCSENLKSHKQHPPFRSGAETIIVSGCIMQLKSHHLPIGYVPRPDCAMWSLCSNSCSKGSSVSILPFVIPSVYHSELCVLFSHIFSSFLQLTHQFSKHPYQQLFSLYWYKLCFLASKCQISVNWVLCTCRI